MTQICTTCLQEKDENDFHWRRDRTRAPRRRRACKSCHAQRMHANYVAHHQKYLAKQALYYATHREEAAAYQRAHSQQIASRMRRWRAANRVYLRTYDRAYRQAHRQQRLQRRRLHDAAFPFETYQQARRWRAKNPQRRKATLRAWKQANPDAIRKHKALRYARQRGASLAVPIAHRDIAERDGWRCHICGKKVTETNWSLDHLIPLSKGGMHIPENVALAHFACNTKRNVGTHIPAQLRLLP